MNRILDLLTRCFASMFCAVCSWLSALVAIAVVVALLTGCATVPTDVVVGKAEVVRVEVPVVIPCISADQIEPLPPTSMPPRDAGVAELANGAAADLLRYRELARKQAEMLRACAK